MDVEQLLRGVASGALTIEQGLEQLKHLPYEDIGFAKLDHHRALRSGFGEVIYCAGKTPEQVVEIAGRFALRSGNVLGTRATPEQMDALRARLPDCECDPGSGVVRLLRRPPAPAGCVAVCTGGTSDLPVAEEAARTAEFFGARVRRVHDVGVAGIHRLFDQLPAIREANCIVAVAGMEGALAGVVAGLVEAPVVAVPTSVGYGANFGGLSALLTMLNACAEGIGVVNIDNGFGAGYLAAQINRLAVSGRGEDSQ